MADCVQRVSRPDELFILQLQHVSRFPFLFLKLFMHNAGQVPITFCAGQ
jgi:hypothetical protein